MTYKLPLFGTLEFETRSTCNRTCPTCLRNNYPDRDKVASWFTPNHLPVEVIKEACLQAIDMGFNGHVCLNHYNEPTEDERLPEIIEMVKSLGGWKRVFFCSNGDHFDEKLAGKLDGLIDHIAVALYMDEPVKSTREEYIKGLFHKTILTFTGGVHVARHHNQMSNATYPNGQCAQPVERLILNHKGDMLLCCSDLIGHFDLGRFPDTPLKDLWWGEKHTKLTLALNNDGNRAIHPHCLSCPITPNWRQI